MSQSFEKCQICNGMGLIPVEKPIKCSSCNGNPRGCYQCSCGYLKLHWEGCSTCFETGKKMKFNEYFKLLHK